MSFSFADVYRAAFGAWRKSFDTSTKTPTYWFCNFFTALEGDLSRLFL